MKEHGSILKGYWFQHKVNDDTISVFCSGLTGKESVYFNDALVSDKYSWKLKTPHHFSMNGKSYTVNIQITSLNSGAISCQFYEEGILLATEEKGLTVKANNKWLILITSLFGAVLGYFVGYELVKWIL